MALGETPIANRFDCIERAARYYVLYACESFDVSVGPGIRVSKESYGWALHNCEDVEEFDNHLELFDAIPLRIDDVQFIYNINCWRPDSVYTSLTDEMSKVAQDILPQFGYGTVPPPAVQAAMLCELAAGQRADMPSRDLLHSILDLDRFATDDEHQIQEHFKYVLLHTPKSPISQAMYWYMNGSMPIHIYILMLQAAWEQLTRSYFVSAAVKELVGRNDSKFGLV